MEAPASNTGMDDFILAHTLRPSMQGMLNMHACDAEWADDHMPYLEIGCAMEYIIACESGEHLPAGTASSGTCTTANNTAVTLR